MNTDNIKKYILLNIPYALMFWFFSKCGEAYRLSTGRDILQKLMGCIANLNTVFARPLPALNPFDLFAGMIGAAAVYSMVWYKKKHAKKWRKDIEYGSARWGAYY